MGRRPGGALVEAVGRPLPESHDEPGSDGTAEHDHDDLVPAGIEDPDKGEASRKDGYGDVMENASVRAKIAAEKRKRRLFNELNKIAFADIRKIGRPETQPQAVLDCGAMRAVAVGPTTHLQPGSIAHPARRAAIAQVWRRACKASFPSTF